MYALEGYIDGNTVITNEDVKGYEGCRVIITILEHKKGDGYVPQEKINQNRRRKAALELAGLWSSHQNERTVEEFVREMREVRKFDN